MLSSAAGASPIGPPVAMEPQAAEETSGGTKRRVTTHIVQGCPKGGQTGKRAVLGEARVAPPAADASPSGLPVALGPQSAEEASGGAGRGVTTHIFQGCPKGGQTGKRAVLKPNTCVRKELLQRMQVAMDELAVDPGEGKGVPPDPTKYMVAEPWDKLRGRTIDGKSEYDVEVPANLERLRSQAAMTLVQHWAPDCATFSRALEKPIPGAPAGGGPQPLRSKLHLRGLPVKALNAQFGPRRAQIIIEKLKLHNLMAELAAQECLKAVQEGRYFCIENPGNSLLWQLPEFKELAAMAGVVWFTMHNCAFGGKRRKYTGVLTNIPGLREAWEQRCGARGDADPCDFSGVAHEAWEPKWVEGFGHTVTKPESEYPKPMCEAMAAPVVACGALAPQLAARLPYAFLEIFSGPNAPLTHAVRRAMALKRQELAGPATLRQAGAITAIQTPPRA